MRITTLFLVAGLIMPGVATGQRAGLLLGTAADSTSLQVRLGGRLVVEPFIGGNERQVLTLQGRELWPWRRHERLHS